jgi:hypothetical protein
MLQMAEKLAQAKVPENVWYIVYQNEAAESKPRVVHGGDQAVRTEFQKATRTAVALCIYQPAWMEKTKAELRS